MSDQQAFNASDEGAIENARRAEGRRLKRNADVLRKLMARPEGRAWLWEFIGNTGAFAPRHIPGDADEGGIYWRDGRASVGLDLFAQATAASKDLVSEMQRENAGQ